MTTQLRQLFPQDKELIYLNHAAVSPWPDSARQAVADFALQNVTQGSLDYLEWLKSEKNLKQQICSLINAPNWNDIALQKNTSEALSVVAYGVDWQKNDNIVSILQEFPSNRVVWDSLVQNRGIEFRQVDLNKASVDIESNTIEDQLIAMCDENTRLMSISAVQFASGLRHDLNKLGIFCRANNILFCVDAIQAIGAVQFDVQKDNIDFAMADGHKWMMGPEGLGFLYVRPAIRESLSLNQYGWHMTADPSNYDRLDWKPAKNATRFECGSPNMLGIHALQASLQVLLDVKMVEVEKALFARIAMLRDYLDSNNDVHLRSSSQPGQFAGIINFSHKKIDNKLLYEKLLEKKVWCALRGGGVRLSPHFYTPLEKLTRAIDIIDEIFKS